VDTLLASIDINTDPRKALSTWMTELQQHTEKNSKEERKNHIQNKQTIIGQLKKIYKKIGDGMGKEGSMKPPTNVEQKEAREVMERKQDEYEERIGECTRKEQQIWLDDRGDEEYTSGERCSGRCFDGMRKVMSFSLMQKVYSKTGEVVRTTGWRSQ
jgi:hypothetical protein